MTASALPAYEESTGNVFADLGLPNPAQEQLKAHLAREIHHIVKRRKLTQSQAARALGIHQCQASALMRARPGAFSVGRLIGFLTILGKDVEIAIRDKRAGRPNRPGSRLHHRGGVTRALRIRRERIPLSLQKGEDVQRLTSACPIK